MVDVGIFRLSDTWRHIMRPRPAVVVLVFKLLDQGLRLRLFKSSEAGRDLWTRWDAGTPFGCRNPNWGLLMLSLAAVQLVLRWAT